MRRLLLSVFVLTLLSCFSVRAGLPAYSADVTVDVTADNAAAARDRAMRQANRQAVNAIAANFTTREGMATLNRLTDDQLLNFVKETTVLEEKASNVRYMAKLRITAHDQLLKQYLQEKNVPLVVASSANVMIVPVFRESEGQPARLWEENNPWRFAWEQSPQTVGSIRFFSPDENSLPSLSADKALALDASAFHRLSELNNGGDVYVAETYPDCENGLTVRILNPQNGKREIFNVNGLLSSELYKQAAQETALRISDELKGRSIVTSSEPETITVLYKFNTLGTWLKAEEKISAITAVENIQINAIGNGRIQFQIKYIGGIDTLRKALQSYHLLLTESGNYYTLIDM